MYSICTIHVVIHYFIQYVILYFPDVASPSSERLKMSDVYDETTGKPSPEALKKHFIKEGRVEEEVALRIINQGLMISYI